MSLRKIFIFGLLSLITFSLGLGLTVLLSPTVSFRDALPNRSRFSFEREHRGRWQSRYVYKAAENDEELAAAITALGNALDEHSLDAVRQRVTLLESRGRAFLGIYPRSAAAGVFVADVMDNNPAAQAGLRGGDVITAINGQRVADLASLRQVLATVEPHVPVSITFERDGYVEETMLRPVARSVKQKLPQTHRALGYAYAAIGRKAEAVQQFESYLSEARRAPDREIISQQINQLSR